MYYIRIDSIFDGKSVTMKELLNWKCRKQFRETFLKISSCSNEVVDFCGKLSIVDKPMILLILSVSPCRRLFELGH